MPLNVRMFCTSILLGLIGFFAIINAQSPPAVQSPTPQVTAIFSPKPPSSGEVMRERISKAKAYIAVRNYNAAIYELENIRRETGDLSVRGVTNVLLMNSYLEQGDYKRAQDFLTQSFNDQKANKPDSTVFYSTVAGQVVKGARNQIERYRALGLMLSERNLPLEAVNDIERMRETLELVVAQSKEIGKDKQKAAAAMALLEEATNTRGALARDDYDARRWKDEIADSRELLANSRSVITNAVDGTTTSAAIPQNTAAANTLTIVTITEAARIPEPVTAFNPVITDSKPANEKPASQEPKKAISDPQKNRVTADVPKQTSEAPTQTPDSQTTAPAEGSPLQLGSLIEYATKRTAPVYPPAAKSMRATGVVKVEVVVNEAGEVSEVQKASGHALLQAAAKDAVMKWKFKPFLRDGQPVKAAGFINFNFSL